MLLEDLIFDAVHAQSANNEEPKNGALGRKIKDILKDGKILRKSKENGRTIVIRDTNDFANFFRRCQNDAYIADMDITNENSYLILYKRTSQLYPVKKNMTCKDWNDIDSKITVAAPPPGTADVITNTANIAVSMGEMAQDAKKNRSAKTNRCDIINYTALPQEVKVQVLARMQKKPVMRSDIFNPGPSFSRRVYNNEYTEDTSNGIRQQGLQQDMSYMEFPDKQWSGTGGV